MLHFGDSIFDENSSVPILACFTNAFSQFGFSYCFVVLALCRFSTHVALSRRCVRRLLSQTWQCAERLARPVSDHKTVRLGTVRNMLRFFCCTISDIVVRQATVSVTFGAPLFGLSVPPWWNLCSAILWSVRLRADFGPKRCRYCSVSWLRRRLSSSAAR